MDNKRNLPAICQSKALMTDFYQITMAYGFWKSGMKDKEGVYHLFFRDAPFQGGYCICCGLENVIEYVNNFKFEDSDLVYLSGLLGDDDKPLFEKEFLDYLRDMKFECDIDAIPEGTVVFPYEPLLRVKGPIIQCQILETPLLNIINFQTLIATKASRMFRAADGDPVLEFGLRRAQGNDGALTASRAAYIGGCSATSNVLAGKVYGIPVKGTIAHSWVMAFEDELEAFQQYAKIAPNNCVLLVDTYATLEGVKKAVKVALDLKERGYQLSGIRLDSGDLAYLSIEARKILDESGLQDVKIVASNDLDESIIQSLKVQNAKIDIWGVGTKLITAYNQPALNGVYKLAAIRNPGQAWEYKIKISEQSSKNSTPGIQQVRRYHNKRSNIADMVYDENDGLEDGCTIVDPFDITHQKQIMSGQEYDDLLVKIYKEGKCVYSLPSLEEIKQRVNENRSQFHSSLFRLVHPHQYPVGNEKSLNDLRMDLMLKARKKK